MMSAQDVHHTRMALVLQGADVHVLKQCLACSTTGEPPCVLVASREALPCQC